MSRAPAREERRAIEAELLDWMREPWDAQPRDDGRFERLALALFSWQFEHCAPYARFCESLGVTPRNTASWRDVPAVPTGAFKEVALRSFPAEETLHVFRTSGTSTPRRGELHLDTLELYEASLLPTLRRFVFPDLLAGERCDVRVLAASPEEAADSSLSHMFGCALAALASEDSGWDVRDGALDGDALARAFERALLENRPLALCGTAFAFVHLLDELAGGRRVTLPAGSRVMETGGFKGRSRSLERDELYAAIEAQLGIPGARIVNQYGMTELGSQFYDSVLAEPAAPRRKLGPPWARVRVLDPESGLDAPPGEVGSISVFDLSNTGSVASILTADLGRTLVVEGRETGFEVVGRSPGAEARGCSLAADAMLGEGE